MDNKSVREGYEELGVEGYYQKHKDDYHNPHEFIIHELVDYAVNHGYIQGSILDLCCGSGEVTTMLPKENVVGSDPYTANLYRKKTGRKAFDYSFKDIIQGSFEGQQFDTIICSFALHLCPESMLTSLLWRLGEISHKLIIITPHKRPNCELYSTNWVLVDEVIIDRVRLRRYLW